MAANVYVDFVARGLPSIERAFRTIADVATRSESINNASAQRGARMRMALAEREARTKEREYAKVGREAQRWQQQAVREAEKASRAEVRVAEQGAREKVRAWIASDREINRARQHGVREAERAARAETRIFEAAEKEKNRSAAKWVKQREREQGHSRESFGRAVLGGASKGASTAVRGVGRAASSMLQVAGGFSMIDSVQREIGLRGQAATLAASTSLAGGKQFTTDQILGKARQVSGEQGMETSDVLEGIGKMKDLTGNIERALQMAPKLAQMATATGGNVGEMSELAGNISASSPNMSNDEVMRVTRVLAKQGAEGAVEVKDAARYGARLTAGASYYGGDRTQNIASVSALSQMARQHGSAASPAEAALAAQRFGSDVVKHADKLEGMGIHVKDGNGTLRDSKDIIRQMMAKTGGDVTKLSGLGIGDRGGKVLEGAASIYRQGGGGAGGQKALDEYLGKLTQGMASDEQIDAMAKQRLGEVDKQLAIQMNRLKDAVGTELLPEFVKLIPVLRDGIPHIKAVMEQLAALAGFLVANPLQGAILGLGAVMTKSIGEELVKAQLGEFMKTKIGASLGTSGLIIGAATIAIASGMVAIDQEFKKGDKRREETWKDTTEAASIAGRIRNGTATEEEKARAATLATKLQTDLASTQNDRKNPGFWKGQAEDIATSPGVRLFTNAGVDAKREEGAQYDREESGLKQAIEQLKLALNDNTTATNTNSTKTVPGGSPARTPGQSESSFIGPPR